ncbi:NACHT domain-containing protein [Actinokineospora auranticolor]|uniref:NACHT domain-containing protein n=1 Tax=Actinokineospora auranticolor TaxID=155976 RepID=UPI0015E2751A|nr:NACHT domain-containing protein [Actinokineospora auranticolor]
MGRGTDSGTPVPTVAIAGGAAVLAAAVSLWHPLAAAAGAVALTGGALLGRHLRRARGRRPSNRLDRPFTGRLTRFPQQYREHVANAVRYVDLKGLRTVGFATPELDDVYVDVSISHQVPHQADPGVVAEAGLSTGTRHSLAQFLDLPAPSTLAVIGRPGSGKTTLLRHTTRVITAADRRRRPVPVLLYLRDHVDRIVGDHATMLPDLVRATLGALAAAEPVGWFGRQLNAGHCVVLLDGLDEISGRERRQRVSDWVERQTAHYPGNDFVITSRPGGFNEAPVAGATVLETRQFTRAQVDRFVRGWYLAVEKLSTGKSDAEVRRRAQEGSDDLLAKLTEAPGLVDFTANPLMLTMIANVHRFRSALPGSRAALYREICEVMLWRRMEAKRLAVELPGDKMEEMLRALAFRMMSDGVREVGRDVVLDLFAPQLRRLPTTLTAQDVLADVSSNGLLVEREEGRFAFAHLTFQEYLAATYIREEREGDLLTDTVDDVWWEETTLLYTATASADAIVAACLRHGSVNALSLAFKCLEQQASLAPELREQLTEMLDARYLDHSTPAQRRVIATILANRHLAEWAYPQRGTRVATTPVPASLYRLFEHDVAGGHPAGAEPVAPGSRRWCEGVPGNRAREFCRWLNALLDVDNAFRLPTGDELAGADGLADVAAWVSAAGPAPAVWTAAGSTHVVTEDDLVDALADDLDAPSLYLLCLLSARADTEALDALVGSRHRQEARVLVVSLLRSLRVAAGFRDPDAPWQRRDRLALAIGVAEGMARGDSAQWPGAVRALRDALSAVYAAAYPAAERVHGLLLTPAPGERMDSTMDSETYLGTAFTLALSDLPPGPGALGAFLAGLRRDSAFDEWSGWRAPPELAHDYAEVLVERLAGRVLDPSDRWSHQATAYLRDLLPALRADHQALTAEEASRARLCCLALSTVARRAHAREEAHQLVHLAGALTLVEYRTNGLLRADETILLAVDWPSP